LGDYILHSNGCQELSIVYALIRTQQALFIGHIANYNNAPEIKLTEEQIREKYPWDTKELTILDLKQIDDKTFNPWVFDCISAQTQYEVTGK
jgi:hypothetical protein